MKKIKVILSFVLLMFVVMPNVSAEAELNKNGTIYGDIYIDSIAPTSASPYSTKIFYITKTTSSGYVYFNVFPVENISDIKIVYSNSAFEKVSEVENSDGSIDILLKTKDGKAINGTKTEVFTATGAVEGDVSEGCNFSYQPKSINCGEIDGNYFDGNGNKVTEEKYIELCEGVTTDDGETPNDEENPQTGSVVPYVAVGGGLGAIALVYLYSRKSNKMYKI